MTASRDDSGFSLIEVLVALLLLAFGMLAVAPLFVYATRVSASSADVGTAGALAVRRMELLRATGFNSLTAGGSLTSNSTGYFDASNVRTVVRWTVSDNATPATVKTITVLAIANRQPQGQAKLVAVTSRRTR